MSKTLVIIESCGKIKKMKAILGDKYEIMASYGHVMDLKEGSLSIDIKNNFEPQYDILKNTKKKGENNNFKSKIQIVKELKEAAKKAKDVLLATDEDREGEMIAWSLAHILNLKDPKRITFNSITKNDVMKAIKSPKKIDYNMVNAQKTRRILDRIVGFEISPILWKHMQGSLSAGRVQSVVVKIIVDKENEITDYFNKDAESYFKLYGSFYEKKGGNIKAIMYQSKLNNSESDSENDSDTDLDNDSDSDSDSDSESDSESDNESDSESDGEHKNDKKIGTISKIKTEKETRELIKKMMKSTYRISNIIEKTSTRNPSPPYTTSTLQQDASTKLGLSVKNTMISAQKLYEAGYITYMRTDSVSLSEDALKNIKEYILENFGKEYYRYIQYKSKSKNSQEAHEAIRPTDVYTEKINYNEKIGDAEIRLYNLIWKRTIACQMSPAIYNIADIIIEISKLINEGKYFVAKEEEIKFLGYMQVYNSKNTKTESSEQSTENNESDETESNESKNISDKSIPQKGTVLKVNNISGDKEYKKPPLRYNEASLVRTLEKLGIGRPSTYATNIMTIQERGYVEVKKIDGIKKDVLILKWNGKDNEIKEIKKEIILGKETNKLVPTHNGIQVNKFLVEYFKKILDYKFTSNMEEDLDKIASGKKKWVSVLDNFYKEFHPIVEELMDKEIKAQDENARVLGKHPEGYEMIATTAKYGPVVKMYKDNKYIYAPIKEPLKIETITLKEAIKLFEYPKQLGLINKKPVLLNKGKYGLYISYEGNVANLSNNEKYKDKTSITLDEAKEILEERKKTYLWEKIDGKNKYFIKEGKYGKYLTVVNNSKKTNDPIFIKITDEIKIDDLTIEDVKKMVKNKNKANNKEKNEKKNNVKENKENKENNTKKEKNTKKNTKKEIIKENNIKKEKNTKKDK